MAEFADATGYERLMGRWSRLLAREFVRFAGIPAGATVLDVGCGTGSLAGAVLESSAPAGVVGVDPSPAFVELARSRYGDTRARFEVGDAQRLPFPDSHFTVAASMLVLNFVPDRTRAVAEMRRVTRTGGLVAACVWDYGGGMEMLRRFWDAADALDPAAAAHHERHMPLCRAGELAALWHACGLERVREEAIDIALPFESFTDFWQPFRSGVGPSGSYTASLAPEAAAALESKLRSELWNDRPQAPLTLTARAWAVVGSVAAAV